MKIKVNKGNIIQVDKVNLNTDIPLSYINSENDEYNINIVTDYLENKSEIVIPYEEFDTLNKTLFDINNNLIEDLDILQRNNNDKYYYLPKNTITFNPLTFNYSVLGKKKMIYNHINIYNLIVNCVDDNNLTLSKKLIKVFGNAPDRNICPKNIFINNKDLSFNSLINNSIDYSDFTFIESKDGTKYLNTQTEINLDDYLDHHTNVWLSIEDFQYSIDNSQQSSLKNPILYNSVTGDLFNVSNFQSSTSIKYHNIFNTTYGSIIIKEYINKGFVIITPKSFIDNIEKNIKLFYETLIYIYINSYLESKLITSWITDYMPTHIIENNIITSKNKFVSDKKYYEILEENKNDIIFISTNIDKEYVIFNGLSNDYIEFKKLFTNNFSKYSDPYFIKNYKISIFTPRQNIILYNDYAFKKEENLKNKINYIQKNNKIIFTIKSFTSSKNNIHTINDTILEYDLYQVINYQYQKIKEDTVYLLYKNNVLKLSNEIEESYIKLAEININIKNEDIKLFDMRQRGGGYPENIIPPVQCIFDVGSNKGIPYRKNNTLIITLPNRLKQYRELLEKEISKYIDPNDALILLFS